MHVREHCRRAARPKGPPPPAAAAAEQAADEAQRELHGPAPAPHEQVAGPASGEAGMRPDIHDRPGVQGS
eukprot:10865534-Alexandrium_andersonii.AAC.1